MTNPTKILLIISLLLGAWAHEVRAQEIVVEGGQAYKLHKVAKGEGFYRLSKENGVSQEDILSANPQLKTTGLVEGVVVRIPIKGENKTAVEIDNRAKASHTVKAGETPYSIAKQYNMTLAELLKLNKSVSNGLREGQEVIVYSKSNTSDKTEQTDLMTQSHTAAKGETLFSIAKQYGVNPSTVIGLNPNLVGGLKEGDVVILPAEANVGSNYVLHVIQSGETLYSIGTRYGVKAQQIAQANVALDPTAMPVGTAIRIPQSKIPAEDEEFIYHRMAQGETLYSLCVKYNLLQERIEHYNTGLDWNALSLGQVVAIPKRDQVAVVTYREHEVKKRETLYSIAKEENVSIEDILSANLGLTADNLQKDMTIKIPVRRQYSEPRPATRDTLYIGDEESMRQLTERYDYVAAGRPQVNVFLMLPFNAWAEMNNIKASNGGIEGSDNTNYNIKSRRYIEFYEGVHLALDSLSQAGANVNLTVFDTNSRLEAINQLNGAQTKPDIIIGPAHKEEMTDVMIYAKKNRVPMVLPFAQCDSTILDNPYIFQASRIDSITGKEMMKSLVKEAAGAHIILLSPRSKNKGDLERNDMFKKSVQENNLTYTYHDFDPKNPTEVLAKLSTEKKNIVLLLTNNEARVNSVLTSLAGVIDQKPEAMIELWAWSDWLSFQTVEVDVFHKLNTKIFSSFAIDYNDAQTQSILNKYRRQYFTEPVAFMPYFQKLKSKSGYSEYGMWGYDVAMQFVGARVFNGPQFMRNLNDYKSHLTQTNFKFKNLTNWGGALNIGLKTITFKSDGSIEVANIE